VHRPVGREDPPQRLFQRSPLGDLGLEQRRLLVGCPEPGGDRELEAVGGGAGLRSPERVSQARLEAGRRPGCCRGCGGRGGRRRPGRGIRRLCGEACREKGGGHGDERAEGGSASSAAV
jgi:hypothetical protein